MMPPRLSVISELERRDHYYLPSDCKCYFWGEYTPYEHTNGLKWSFSPTNQLVSNLKKKMDRVGKSDWPHKLQAINDVAHNFSQFWLWGELHGPHRVSLIPVPPSKARTDAMYDPRMMQILQGIAVKTNLPLDIRDCLSFNGAFAASHESVDRPKPDDLYAALLFDEAVGKRAQPPGAIFLFDDMLTTGAHYVAACRKLNEVFPGVPIVGNFVARRIVPNPFDDFDVID